MYCVFYITIIIKSYNKYIKMILIDDINIYKLTFTALKRLESPPA